MKLTAQQKQDILDSFNVAQAVFVAEPENSPFAMGFTEGIERILELLGMSLITNGDEAVDIKGEADA